MLWSTLKPAELPAPGQEVVYSHEAKRWMVQQRIRDEHGQVWLDIQRGTDRRWERIECLQWAPIPGDVCVSILRPYIDWVQSRIDWEREMALDDPTNYRIHMEKAEAIKKEMSIVEEAGSWLYLPLHVREIAHNWATVQANGKGMRRQLPAQCLAVLTPCPRVQQLEVAA